jgi:DNA-binding transcriptional regulator YdaS (Cro superfamily)
MDFQKVIDHFSTQVAVAKALGITQPAVALWRIRKRIPALRQLQIERASKGRLKASAAARRELGL